ncbi:uncharacterized protein (DUF736 family) [Tunturiibacter psychrotolerans]
MAIIGTFKATENGYEGTLVRCKTRPYVRYVT